MIWLIHEKRLAIFPAGTIVREPPYRESPTGREKGLNLCRTWVQAWLNDAVQQYYTTAPQINPILILINILVEAEDEIINLNAVCNIELPDTGVVILEGTIISRNLSRMEMTFARDLNP